MDEMLGRDGLCTDCRAHLAENEEHHDGCMYESANAVYEEW